MKIKNYTCIFALCAIIMGFFAFGIVANAEETNKYTYYYNITYKYKDSYKYASGGSRRYIVEEDKRVCLIRIGYLCNDPSWEVLYGNYDNCISYDVAYLNGGKMNVGTNVRTKCLGGESFGKDGTISAITPDNQFMYYNGPTCLTIDTDMPIFENTSEGLALAEKYLTTGEAPVTIPNLEDKSHYDESYYFMDFKATDFVNATWSGMGNTSKISDDGHTTINHMIAVKYIYGYRGMSVENYTLSDPYPNSGNSLSIDFTPYKPTKDEQYISAVVYTPYYTSGSSYFYGRPVSVVLSPSGKIQKVTNPVVDGDYEQVMPPIDGQSIYDSGFKLIDFKTDKTGYSTWNGCTDKQYDPFNYTKDSAYVNVTLGYAYKTAPGQIALKYDTDLGFLISANKASINMSALAPEIVLKGKKNSNGIEYDTSQVFLRYIKYTPCYSYSGIVYYGKSNDIYFKLDGSTDVTYTDREPTNGDQNQGGGLGDLTNIKPSAIFDYFTNLLKTLVNATQNIAPFINNIFGFLPDELRTCVYATFAVICACAVIRAIVGIFIS